MRQNLHKNSWAQGAVDHVMFLRWLSNKWSGMGVVVVVVVVVVLPGGIVPGVLRGIAFWASRPRFRWNPFGQLSVLPLQTGATSQSSIYSMIILICNIRTQFISVPWRASNFYSSLFWRYIHCIYVIAFQKIPSKFLYHFWAVCRYGQIRICRG